jgi:hypothetical protein
VILVIVDGGGGSWRLARRRLRRRRVHQTLSSNETAKIHQRREQRRAQGHRAAGDR